MLRRAELADAVDDRLFFAQVREDPRLELAAFRGRWDGPIAVVSSAGCTALSLVAEGAGEVVGVDLNRTQNHLVELKAAAVAELDPDEALAALGGTAFSGTGRLHYYRRLREALTPRALRYWDARPELVARGVLDAGVTEWLMRLIARAIRVFVHPRGRVDRLLRLRTVAEQQRFYAGQWDNARWRLLFALLCNRFVLRRTYDPAFFANVENPSFARHFRQVVEHTLTRLPVHDNYFLHHLLTGRYPEGGVPPYLAARVPALAERLTLVDGGFTHYLRTRADGSLAGFSLSNICEWLTAEQIDDLFAEIVRTARPGARLVFRNFVGWTEVPSRWRDAVREDPGLGASLMRLDRSMCQRRFAVCEVWPRGRPERKGGDR
jgi:S-adenosylmethionine-diacylglycerol 3-amino-3-carboxypropyl transferase